MGTAATTADGTRRPLALLRLTLRYLRPYGSQSILALLTILVDIAFTISFYFGIKVLIDSSVQGGDRTQLGRGVAGLVALFVVATLSNLARERLQAVVDVRLSNDLRVSLLDRLQRLGADFYQRTPTTELVAQVSGDIATVNKAVTGAFPTVVRQGMQIVSICILLIVLEWRLACIVVATLGMILLVVRTVSTRSARLEPPYARDDASVLAAIEDAIAGHLVLKLFGLQRAMLSGVRADLARFAAAGVRVSFTGRLISRTLESGVAMIQLLVVGLGVFMVSGHSLAVGALAAFLGLLGVLGSALTRISLSLPDWLASTGAMKRIDAMLHLRPVVMDASGAVELQRFAREIRFTGVSFSYPGETVRALRDINIAISAGQSVAFVGRNGSGKSTMLSLLLRLWDPSEGTITVDGHDLREVTQESLHSQFGVVFQETFVFQRSIRENIVMGRPASDVEVAAVTRAAHAHDVIAGLSDGYDTILGKRGRRLSAGQRQRLALARALLRDPAVLVLDEATAALDPAAEAAFVETVQGLAGTRTIVSVAHRLEHVVDADRIFVMDNGRVVESGTHQHLLALDGVYRDLWEKQTGFLIDHAGRQARVTTRRLRRIPLFASIDEAQLATLAGQFVVERFDAGEVIVAQGDHGDTFYLIVRGAADVLRSHNGEERRLDMLGDGDYFGEMALLADMPRTATVRATRPCLVLALGYQDFQALMAGSPALRGAIDQLVRVREQRISAIQEHDGIAGGSAPAPAP